MMIQMKVKPVAVQTLLPLFDPVKIQHVSEDAVQPCVVSCYSPPCDSSL
jgi:hypothetical protein